MFFFYSRVNVLFLLCKKVGPLILNRNIKTRNEERSFLKYRNSQQHLKSVKKELKTSRKTHKSVCQVLR